MEGQWQQQLGGDDVHHPMDGQWQQHGGDDLDLTIGSVDGSMDLLWANSHGAGEHDMDELFEAADANMMGNINDAADGAASAAAEEGEHNGGEASVSSGKRTARFKRKRHSKEQIRQLEAVFKDIPHPDDKLRNDLSMRVGLTYLQVKFWFQNRRSSTKNKAGRQDTKVIRRENQVLRAENQAIRAAILQKTCRTCGGPTMPIQETPEQRRLRFDNARLKDELMRAAAILHMVSGKAPVVRPMPVPGGYGLPVDLSNVGFGTGGASVMPFPPPPPRALADPMLFAPEGCLSSGYCAAVGNASRAELQRYVQRASDEFMLVANRGKPIWLPTPEGDVLNCQDYADATFPSILGVCPMGFAVDGTRETGMVMATAGDLVRIFTDAARWSEMFPDIVAGATASKLVIPGAPRQGLIQLMKAELRVLSPRVPVRKVKFIRQCQLLEPGTWALVDVSVDGIGIPEADDGSTAELHEHNGDAPPKYTAGRLMPSGCLIEDMKNGYSKVTWIVIAEYDETSVPPLYHPLLRSGHALGARRWLASLQRQCEYLAVPTRTLGSTGGIPPEGRNGVLQLAQRMMASFYAGMSGQVGQSWRSLDEWCGGHGVGSDRFELAVRFVTTYRAGGGAPGEQAAGALVLTATTTVWLPGIAPHCVFDYLSDGERRGEWDTLANGAPVQKEGYVATGQLHGNAVSVLRPNASDGTGNNKLILQEARVDASCMLLVYAPFGEQSMVEVMSGGGGGDASVFLLPAGFVVLPDGHSEPRMPRSADAQRASNAHASQSNAGSVVSAMYQTLLSGPPPESIPTGTIEKIGYMLCRAMKKIKDAVHANIVVTA